LFSDIDNFHFPKIDSTLEILIITSKHDDSFQQSTISSELTSVTELLDLKLSDEELTNPYNDRILDKRKLFNRAYLELATKLKSFKIKFIYVSRGNSDCVGENVSSKAEQLIKTTQSLFSGCDVTYNFIGAKEILEFYRKKKEFNLSLPFEEQLSASCQKYIILCNIKEYYRFLTNEDGELRRYLFDSNVVLLRTDKWQEHAFTFNARIAFKYIFGALIERHTKHLRAVKFNREVRRILIEKCAGT